MTSISEIMLSGLLFPSPDEASGAKQAGDHLSDALIPRLQVTSTCLPRTLTAEVRARNQKDCPCGKKGMLLQITEVAANTKAPRKERRARPKLMPALPI